MTTTHGKNNLRRTLMSRPIVLALVALTLLPSSGPAFLSDAYAQEAAPAVPPTVPAEEQPEALTRGPVHEAFATPLPAGDQEPATAPSAPPANISEDPPLQRPTGDNVVWVPGYWSWDADRKDYIWISACWRTTVPGMEWVPGYWRQAESTYQWVPGFWSKTSTREIEYLPPPPAVDIQPVAAAPSPDVIWVPPCHYWMDGHYVLRNGYWLNAQPGWVWCPSYYTRTPRGYVFVAGHWDYEFENRGVLFAPVYISPVIYTRPHYRYRPTIVIQTSNLSINLFACPRYSHFYFGDYYDNVYINVGIYPWYECNRRSLWYDPCFYHNRWRDGRRDFSRWDNDRRRDYDDRRNDANLRPPRTYREMETRVARAPGPGNEAQRRNIQIATPLERYANDRVRNSQFRPMSNDERRQFTDRESQLETFRQDRSRWESQKRDDNRDDNRNTPSASKDRNDRGNDNRNDRGTPGAPGNSGRDASSPKDNKGPDRVKTQGSPVANPAPAQHRAPEPNKPPVRANDRRDSSSPRTDRPAPGNSDRDSTNPPSSKSPDRSAPSNPDRGSANPPPSKAPDRPAPSNPDRGSANPPPSKAPDRPAPSNPDRGSANPPPSKTPDRPAPSNPDRGSSNNPNRDSSDSNRGNSGRGNSDRNSSDSNRGNSDRNSSDSNRGNSDRNSSDSNRGNSDRNSSDSNRSTSTPTPAPTKRPERPEPKAPGASGQSAAQAPAQAPARAPSIPTPAPSVPAPTPVPSKRPETKSPGGSGQSAAPAPTQAPARAPSTPNPIPTPSAPVPAPAKPTEPKSPGNPGQNSAQPSNRPSSDSTRGSSQQTQDRRDGPSSSRDNASGRDNPSGREGSSRSDRR